MNHNSTYVHGMRYAGILVDICYLRRPSPEGPGGLGWFPCVGNELAKHLTMVTIK